MSDIQIGPGETELLVSASDDSEYFAQVTGTRVQLARTAQAARLRGRNADAGDRGPLRSEENEEVWAYNPHDEQTAKVHLDHNGFWFERQARAVVGSVLTSDQSEASPANDDDVHVFGTDVDVNAEAVSESLEAPDAADSVVVHCDDADGAFGVTVEFLDGPNGNVVTARDGDDNPDYDGDDTSDVLVEVTGVASPWIRVRIADESGASNSLDYSIYAR
jgi:hypothetical protein